MAISNITLKLSDLIRQTEEGKYALSDDGREALRILNEIEETQQSTAEPDNEPALQETFNSAQMKFGCSKSSDPSGCSIITGRNISIPSTHGTKEFNPTV